MTESTIPFLGNEYPQGYNLAASLTYQWDVSTLQWAKGTQPLIAGGVVVAGITDGGDVAEGATTDAAVVTDTTGTVSGKLRGLVKWAFERMPASLGQKTMAASFPVTIASDQSAVAGLAYDSQIAKYQRISPIGGAIVEQTTRLCGAQFEGSLSNGAADNFWITARGTNATSVLAAKIVTLTSGATNSDWCSIRSEHPGRFLFANPNLFRALVKFAGVAAANTTTYIGAMSITNGVPQNGFGFAVDGAGVVSVKSWNATAAVINAASGFNGTLGTTYSIPDANVHAFEIIYYAAKAWYFIDGSLLHSAGPTTAILSGEMSLFAAMSVVNGASPTSRVVECWNASILRFGKEVSRPNDVYIAANATTLLKTGAGTLHRVIIGDGTVGTVIIYDGLTATTIIASLSTLATTPPAVYEMGLDFFTGLTVVTSAGTKVTCVFD